MLNLKKTAVAVLALGSSAVFAGTMGPVCTPGSVTVPCERNAWNFGAQALYLQTTGTDFVGVTSTGTTDTFNNFDHNWGWGFKIEGSYHFSTGSDIDVNWYHYNKTTTNNYVAVPVVGIGAVPFALSVEPKWDAVNFEVGQHVDFGEQSNIRFHGGAQYARIQRDFSLYLTAPATFVANGQQKYNGFGPRVGMDMSYDLGNGLAIYGNGATALLVGDSKFSNTFNAAFPVTATNGSRTIIVPELEGKLGLTYTYAMAQGDLSLDAGYMWVNYFDVHNNGSLSSQTNFGIHGPYVGGKWVGNFA